MALRCNAQQVTTTGDSVGRVAPQKRPRFSDSSWGRERARFGWSLRQLAELTGINAGELSRIERGRGILTTEQAIRLLVAFHRVREL